LIKILLFFFYNIRRSDGTRHTANWQFEWNGFTALRKYDITGVSYGPGIVKIGSFRIAEVDNEFLAIQFGLGAELYNPTGNIHNGPRWDYVTYRNDRIITRAITTAELGCKARIVQAKKKVKVLKVEVE
jgi:hypothetical protein